MKNLQGHETQNPEESLKEAKFLIMEYDKQLYLGLVV
jgi:hypothetical protein